MKFVIPGYQRGYRWTEPQVKDLLRDISDFMAEPSNSLQFCVKVASDMDVKAITQLLIDLRNSTLEKYHGNL